MMITKVFPSRRFFSDRRSSADLLKTPRVFLIGIVLVLCMQFGCSPATAPMSDAVQAKVLLQKTLDEWKSGTSLDEIRKHNPPVYVTEDLWRSGAKLNEYSIAEDSGLLGSNIRLEVNLKFTNKSGNAIKKSFRYIVTTRPALTIVREEG